MFISLNSTIELLKTTKDDHVTSQAANELGDVYYYQGNVKNALIYWNLSLDQVSIIVTVIKLHI